MSVLDDIKTRRRIRRRVALVGIGRCVRDLWVAAIAVAIWETMPGALAVWIFGALVAAVLAAAGYVLWSTRSDFIEEE